MRPRWSGVGAWQDIQLFWAVPRQAAHPAPTSRPTQVLTAARLTMASRPHTRIAADERAAQIDLIVREAHRQAVAQKGGVRKIAQVYLTAGRLLDNTGVIRLNGKRHRSAGRAEASAVPPVLCRCHRLHLAVAAGSSPGPAWAAVPECSGTPPAPVCGVLPPQSLFPRWRSQATSKMANNFASRSLPG